MRNQMNRIASLLAMGIISHVDNGKNYLNRDNVTVEKPKLAIPKGCQLYIFGEFECIALNKASALKKYNKWLLNKS